MMKYVETDGSSTHTVGYEYDSINNLTALVETINGVQDRGRFSVLTEAQRYGGQGDGSLVPFS